MDNDEQKRRFRFQQGEISGGKGIVGAFLSGDPDFESGVKTHLLHEQNKLIEEEQREEKRRRRGETSNQAAREGWEWLLNFEIEEKEWKPFIERENVSKLTDKHLNELCKVLSDVVESVSNARSDAWRGSSSQVRLLIKSNIGSVVNRAHDNFKLEIRRRIEAERSRSIGEGGKEAIGALHSLERVNWAAHSYIDSGYSFVYVGRSAPKERIEKISENAEKAKECISDILKRLAQASQAVMEQQMDASLKAISDEFMRGPNLARDYYKARRVADLKARRAWLAAFVAIVTFVVTPAPIPWYLYLATVVTPHLLYKASFEKPCVLTLDAWKRHVEKIADIGNFAANAFQHIAGRSDSAIAHLYKIELPDRMV